MLLLIRDIRKAWLILDQCHTQTVTVNLMVSITQNLEVSFFLHLFTGFFCKDLSLLVRINYNYFVPETYPYHQCSKYLLARRPAASNFSVGPVTLKTCQSGGLVTFFKHFFRHHTYCRLSQIYHLPVHLTQNRTAAKSVQYNKTLPSGQDIRHGPIRLNCSWPLPKKQTKRQSIWNTSQQRQRGGCQSLEKKGSESVISPLVPFATCKLD